MNSQRTAPSTGGGPSTYYADDDPTPKYEQQNGITQNLIVIHMNAG